VSAENESGAEVGEAESDTAEDATAIDADEATADPDPKPRPGDSVRGWVSRHRSRLIAAVLAVTAIAAIAAAAALYWRQYLPDRQTDSAAADAVMAAATDGTIALLSYSPDSLDEDFAKAKSYLTGEFLSYYNDFTQQVVTPAARQKGVSTTAAVVQAAVSELHPSSATVLAFVNQTTTSNESAGPSMAVSTVMVHLTKVDGSWLISSFDPV